MGARYYDPMGGRFLSTDPIGCPININLYAYANGDPINYFDPDGRFHSPAYKTVQPSTFGIRAMGVLRGVGGMFETAGGGAFALGTAPTGIGFVGGSLLMAHGLDNAMTGFRQAFSGRVAESATSQLLQKTGLSQNHASLIDDGIGMFGPMALAIGMVKLEAKAASYGLRALKEAESFIQSRWVLPENGGGAMINNRWYTEHALERMAPNTPKVMALLETRTLARAQSEGLAPQTSRFMDWLQFNKPDPRGIPPLVVEAEIANPGSTGFRVILNHRGDVVSVIHGGT